MLIIVFLSQMVYLVIEMHSVSDVVILKKQRNAVRSIRIGVDIVATSVGYCHDARFFAFLAHGGSF